jgi:hypothetical protein
MDKNSVAHFKCLLMHVFMVKISLHVCDCRFTQVTQSEAGQYICHAESKAGSTTAVATLVVNTMPKITVSPSTDVQVVVGQKVKLECRATGEPQPTVEWSKHRTGHAF